MKKEPTPVKIVDAEKPVPVKIEEEGKEPVYMEVGHGKTLAPTTTTQEDIVTAGQRRINLIWEITQAFIAVSVVLANLIAALFNVFHDKPVDVPMILSSSLFLIIGFYFSRTNHQAIGGEGKKPSQEYKGR